MSDEPRLVEIPAVTPPQKVHVDAETRKTLIRLKKPAPKLKIMSFLGRPAAGGDFADEVHVAKDEEVVLAWNVVGATELALVKLGPDGEGIPVASGLEHEGEHLVVADGEHDVYHLQATAESPHTVEFAAVDVFAQAPPSTLKIESFVGHPSDVDADEATAKVKVRPMGRVVLRWEVVGAKELRLLRTGKDGKQSVVAEGLAAKGTHEVTADQTQLRFTLEASASRTELELADVDVTTTGAIKPLRIDHFTGRPEGSGKAQKGRVAVAQGERVQLEWRVEGAERVQLFIEVAGKRSMVDIDAPAESNILANPEHADQVFVLEATAGEQRASERLQVTVSMEKGPPHIVAFDGKRDEGNEAADVAFTWEVKGAYSRVRLLPFGDVTADTSPVGRGHVAKPPAGTFARQEYRLVLLDENDQVADQRDLVLTRTAPPPPNPVRIAEFTARKRDSKDPFVKEVKNLKKGEEVVLNIAVQGPHRRVYVSPAPGLVSDWPQDAFTRQLLVSPRSANTGADQAGQYHLVVDDRVRDVVQMKFNDDINKIELQPQFELELDLWKLKRIPAAYFEFKLKFILGMSFKVYVGEGETVETVKFNVKESKKLKVELGRDFKCDSPELPDWVVEHVEKVRPSVATTIDLKKGEANVSAKFQVTLRPLKLELFHGAKMFQPKGELELVGIKIKRGAGGWELASPGTIKGKVVVEEMFGKIAKDRWDLPWDLFDCRIYAGFGIEVEPDWLRIATEAIGFDGLISMGLVVVAVGVIVGVVQTGIELDQAMRARTLFDYCWDYTEQLMPHVEKGLRDPKWEDLLTPNDPQNWDPGKIPERGYLLGQWRRGELLQSFRKQDSTMRAVAIMRAHAEGKMEPQELEAALDHDVIAWFHQQMDDPAKFREIVVQTRHDIFKYVRERVYLDFRKSTKRTISNDPSARDIAFRNLFLQIRFKDGEKTITKELPARFDYDLPAVSDLLFERAMDDLWHAAIVVGDKAAVAAQWIDAGYTFDQDHRGHDDDDGPFIVPAAQRRNKKKLGQAGHMYDVVSGKELTPADAAPREVLFGMMKGKGLIPREETIRKTPQQVKSLAGWQTHFDCELHLPQSPRVHQCFSGTNLEPINPVLIGMYSSDHQAEFMLADFDVRKSAFAKAKAQQPG